MHEDDLLERVDILRGSLFKPLFVFGNGIAKLRLYGAEHQLGRGGRTASIDAAKEIDTAALKYVAKTVLFQTLLDAADGYWGELYQGAMSRKAMDELEAAIALGKKLVEEP